MAEPTHNYTRLPGKLRNELGISKAEYEGARQSRSGPARRKKQRKADRLEKKSKHVSVARPAASPHSTANSEDNRTTVSVEQRRYKVASVQSKEPRSILKGPKVQSIASAQRSSPHRVARRVRDKIVEDDAEISALEKALGVKDKSKLPKAFEEDGLDDLLEGLDNNANGLKARSEKRGLSEENEWLIDKRRKVQDVIRKAETSNDEDYMEQRGGEDGILSLGKAEAGEGDDEILFSIQRDEDETFDGLSEDDDFGENKTEGAELIKATRPPRENPYVAPVTVSADVASGKYVPPSLRNRDPTQAGDLSRLRKQVQGLLNRLSEASMLSIVGDVEKLYMTSPRQHVSSTILDMLLGLLSDPSSLQDTFIILHAGFIAALYKSVGADFGAQAVKRIDEEFLQYYETHDDGGLIDRRLVNLTSLLAELHNFQVISSVLIYDYIRLFLNELSETNLELLIKIIRNAGSQLRQDDPSSLKAIVQSLQDQITKAGEEVISTKIKFMMETMNGLKKNRLKTGAAASAIASEHTVRMKKILGTLNRKRVKASEPLRVSLTDLRESERQGKWWLVGSSYKDHSQVTVIQETHVSSDRHENVNDANFEIDTAGDLARLAKEQRMNTSVRQSIFIAIMSATDCNDAYLRLMKLHLKKAQELEIPRVLIHCSGGETVYNPFYTLLARKLSSDRKLKMAFQFSLWDLFKEFGDEHEESGDQNKNGGEKLGLRAMVNLARMFGSLIADSGLGLGVLKNVNLAHLPSKTQTFLEILLITTILQSQKEAKGARNEAAIIDIFLKPKEMNEMARGLVYFLKKIVSKSDITGSNRDKETVKWGCKVANSVLKELMNKTLYDV